MRTRQDIPGVLTIYADFAIHLDAIHLANIYGALAHSVKGLFDITKLKSDERFKRLFNTTVAKIQTNPNWYNTRSLSAIAQSLGKLNISDAPFFDEIVKLHGRIVKEADVQALSNVCWAFATLGQKKADALFEAIAAQHVRIVEKGSVQEVSERTSGKMAT